MLASFTRPDLSSLDYLIESQSWLIAAYVSEGETRSRCITSARTNLNKARDKRDEEIKSPGTLVIEAPEEPT